MIGIITITRPDGSVIEAAPGQIADASYLRQELDRGGTYLVPF